MGALISLVKTVLASFVTPVASLTVVGLVTWCIIRYFYPDQTRGGILEYIIPEVKEPESPPTLKEWLRKSTKNLIESNYNTFVDNLRSVDEFVDHLYSSHLINTHEKSEVGSQTTDYRKARWLFDNVVLRGTYGDLMKFRAALRDSGNQYLADMLPQVDLTDQAEAPASSSANLPSKSASDRMKRTLDEHHREFLKLTQQIRDLQQKSQSNEFLRQRAEQINKAILQQLDSIKTHLNEERNFDLFYKDIEERYKIFQSALSDVIRRQEASTRQRKMSDSRQEDILMCLKALKMDVQEELEENHRQAVLARVDMENMRQQMREIQRQQILDMNKFKSSIGSAQPVQIQKPQGFRAYIDMHHSVNEGDYLCFSQVDYNTDYCFEQSQNWFRCRLDGIYIFSLSLTLARGGLACVLLQNGQPRARLEARENTGSACITLQMLCNLNDTVSVKVVKNLKLGIVSFGRDNDYLGTCFSGYRQPYQISDKPARRQ